MAFHKRVAIFRREFLPMGKNGPFGKVPDCWSRFEYQERGRVQLHGVVWCEANSIPDNVICATMPRESAALTRSSQRTYGICTRSATWCIDATPRSVSILVVGVYAPNASRIIPLACRKREKNWMTVESACLIADMKPKMHVLFRTIAFVGLAATPQ